MWSLAGMQGCVYLIPRVLVWLLSLLYMHVYGEFVIVLL